jgi:hypothetical protein
MKKVMSSNPDNMFKDQAVFIVYEHLKRRFDCYPG